MATHAAANRSPNSLASLVFLAAAGGLAIFFCGLFAWTIGYQLVFAGRIFPGVSVAGVDISGLPPESAALRLSQTLSFPITGRVLFRDGDQTWLASPAELGMVFDPTASARAAYQLGRSGGPFRALAAQIRAQGSGVEVAPVVIFDQRVAYSYLQNIAAAVDKPVVEANLAVQGSDVTAVPGQVGRSLNFDTTFILLGAQLQSFRDGEVPLAIQEVAPVAQDLSAQANTARQILSQPLTLVLPNSGEGDVGPWVYDAAVVGKLLTLTRDETSGSPVSLVGLDEVGLGALLNDLKPLVDRRPADARFIFNDATLQLDIYQPSRVGRTMDVPASAAAINEALRRGDHSVALVVAEEQPSVPDTATGADLGITQNIITYSTYFYGSSAERIQNIKTAAERFRGVLVAPGATFSMGETLGDVSLDNGFAEALIIYGGRTIKGVGGGVCQVSTTLFRTVFFAGFPVAQRVPHAYRVSYYEQTASGTVDTRLAGLDATVYFPLVDFQFVNDTPHWLLMEAYVYEGERRIEWKFYSTPDGRTVDWTTTGPRNIVKPPPPLFELNPELNKNQIKQVDWAANGADVSVTRTVYRDGQVYFTDTFETHYEDWQAVCEYGPGTDEPEKLAKRKNICGGPAA